MRVPPLCNVPNMYRENVAFLIGAVTSTTAVGRLEEESVQPSASPMRVSLVKMWVWLSSPQSTARLENTARPLSAAGRQVPITASARMR